MAEEFINCRNCGRAVPKTMYCIYCGSGLQGGEQLRPEAQEQPPEAIIPDFKFEPLRQIHMNLKVEGPFPLIRTEPELDKGFLDQIEELRKHWAWQLKLVDMLTEIGVSEEVFTKIYKEYVKEIDQLSMAWNEKIRDYEKKYEDKKAELKKYKQEQEELRVRVAVGQIPDSDLFIRTPQLIDVINSLNIETSKLEAKISKLNKLIWEIPGKGVSELKKMVRKCIESLDGLVRNGKISDELRGQLLNDLKGVIAMLNSTTIDGKEKMEKELKDELQYLMNLWERIKTRSERQTSPVTVYEEYGIVLRMIRDNFTEDVTRLVVDSKEEYARILKFLKAFMPALKKKVKELEEFHDLAVGRELKMKQMEQRIKELKARVKGSEER